MCDLDVITNKDKYGEVFTPQSLVEEMYENLQNIHFFEKHKINRIFETGAGQGVFYEVFQNIHQVCGRGCTPMGGAYNANSAANYVMNEINEAHRERLINVMLKSGGFGKLVIGDFFELDGCSDLGEGKNCSFDLIIGNLPFNSNMRKFVPSNSGTSISGGEKQGNFTEHNMEESKKGKTIWTHMVHKLYNEFLKVDGFMYLIIPCIWLKPDNAGIYELFTKKCKIHLLRVYNCVEANKIFGYNCQTPICYVLVQKTSEMNYYLGEHQSFHIYDNNYDDSPPHKFINFELLPGKCIPTSYAQLFKIHTEFIMAWNDAATTQHEMFIPLSQKMNKICSLKRDVLEGKLYDVDSGVLQDEDLSKYSASNAYKIITGAKYFRKTDKLGLNGFIGEVPGLYYGKKKLILAHKRLPIFVKDTKGEYGLIGRDMYVILCNSDQEINELYDFLKLSYIQKMIQNGFTIRMNFIEKYVFDYLPWIYMNGFNLHHYLNMLCY